MLYICTVQEIVVTQPIWSLRSSSHMLDSSTGKELQLNENPSAGWNLITNSLVRTTSPTTTSKINIL